MPGRGPEIKGIELDPLTGSSDPKKPLLSKLLAVPALKARYLGYVQEMAEQWLDWGKLGPIAEQYRNLIADEVRADTRKLATTEAFEAGFAAEAPAGGDRGPQRLSLKSFAEQRRAYLLSHPEIQKLHAQSAQSITPSAP